MFITDMARQNLEPLVGIPFCAIPRQLRVKVTPVGVGICGDPSGLPTSVSATADIEESWDVQEMRSVTRHWPIIEVAVSIYLSFLFSCLGHLTTIHMFFYFTYFFIKRSR